MFTRWKAGPPEDRAAITATPHKRRPLWFLRDTSGATAVLMSVMMPMMVLGIGFGAETGYQYMTQRKLQHAADLSAHAGAARLRAGDDQDGIGAAAAHVAVGSGFQPDVGTITVNTPPATGPSAGSAQSVEVILTQSLPRYFSLLIRDDRVMVAARAVARVVGSGSTACVLALAPTASGAVTVTGSTSVDLDGCDIASNSNAGDALLMAGSSAALSADCAHAVGQAVVTAELQLSDCPSVREFAPVVRDPYADVAEPAVVGQCHSRNQGSPNRTTTLSPADNHPSGVRSMRFCNGLDLRGDVQLDPGLYIIEGGDLTINGGNIESSGDASLSGEGVTFFLSGTSGLRLGGNGFLSLAAPASGPFSGIVVFASPHQTGITHRITGASGSALHGAVYAPSSEVELTGNSRATDGCTQVIGWTVTFTGNSSFRSNCAASGTRAILTSETIAIIE